MIIGSHVCRNPQKQTICLCPVVQSGIGVRDVLSRTFINGWISEGLTKAANAMASDPSSSELDLWKMLFRLEEIASDMYEYWKGMQ